MRYIWLANIAGLSLCFSAVEFLILIFILWRVMSSTPVSQQVFDAALANLNTGFTSLLNAFQSVISGLADVEAALKAAQSNPTATDFSSELATVQNLQAEATAAQATAEAAIASLPAPVTPPAPSA